MKTPYFAATIPMLFAGLLLFGDAHAKSESETKPSTQVTTEYLMTYQAKLDPPDAIDDSMLIFNVKSDGGWIKGPKINGKFVPPGGDWLRVMPSGALRLDVRATIKTDDGALIYMSYNGIMQHTEESLAQMNKGELMTTEDIPYFMTAPTFQTASPKYAWLNGVQAVGKVVELKLGADGYVTYDIFIVR